MTLTDEDRDWIDHRADQLFRESESLSGGVRGQTIQRHHFRDYFVVDATLEWVRNQTQTELEACVVCAGEDNPFSVCEWCQNTGQVPRTRNEDYYTQQQALRGRL